jgi:hypothetical protein
VIYERLSPVSPRRRRLPEAQDERGVRPRRRGRFRGPVGVIRRYRASRVVTVLHPDGCRCEVLRMVTVLVNRAALVVGGVVLR